MSAEEREAELRNNLYFRAAARLAELQMRVLQANNSRFNAHTNYTILSLTNNAPRASVLAAHQQLESAERVYDIASRELHEAQRENDIPASISMSLKVG